VIHLASAAVTPRIALVEVSSFLLRRGTQRQHRAGCRSHYLFRYIPENEA